MAQGEPWYGWRSQGPFWSWNALTQYCQSTVCYKDELKGADISISSFNLLTLPCRNLTLMTPLGHHFKKIQACRILIWKAGEVKRIGWWGWGDINMQWYSWKFHAADFWAYCRLTASNTLLCLTETKHGSIYGKSVLCLQDPAEYVEPTPSTEPGLLLHNS